MMATFLLTDTLLAAGQLPVIFWFAGLSGAGKSTLAFALERRLLNEGNLSFVLDGDNVRHGLCADLDFSSASRSENIRRVAEVAKLFNEAGLISICSLISPFFQDREIARSIIGVDRYFEVYVSTPLPECERRDVKGLYAKARAGVLNNFTGVDMPYEIPQFSDCQVDTSGASVDSSIDLIVAGLAQWL